MSISDKLYTQSYMQFMESSERTGLLYEVALGLFEGGQVTLTDNSGHKIVVPIITKESFIDGSKFDIIESNESFEDIDSLWMDRVFTRLNYQNSGDIWNGEVSQVSNITDEEITLNESTYFTLASHREKYISDIAEHIYSTSNEPQITRKMSEIKETVYSLMGITYTTIIDPPSEDSRYLVYGKRSSDMNELGSFRVTAPAGIVQPRHIQGNDFDSMIRSHFIEEFTEELLHEKMTEEEFEEHIDEPYIEWEFNGLGIDPLRYSTELAVSVNITGDFARYVLNNISTNEEMVKAKVYDIGSVKTVYNPLFARGLTPQSLFSLGLYLNKTFPEWTVSVEN